MNGYRLRLEEKEKQVLSPHACLASASLGRQRPTEPCPVRTYFQRDRDRILHSKAIRRLAHKTQVFLSPVGDHYRTRMTHTMEMTQIARTIARALGLNEDLTEAAGLGHDLGHTPFGHAGEAILNKLVDGGFHHVQQSVRVVDVLEREGRGLNLTREVREGIQKHSKGKGAILVKDPTLAASTLEAQVVRVADIIAYVNHDLDDAIRARVLLPDDVPAELQRTVGRTHSERITNLVVDVLNATDLDQVRLIRISTEMDEALTALRAFLYQRVYENPEVHQEFIKTERVLTTIWNHFINEDSDLFRREYWPQGLDPETPIERAVTDVIASMTDRYALRLYRELFLPHRWSII